MKERWKKELELVINTAIYGSTDYVTADTEEFSKVVDNTLIGLDGFIKKLSKTKDNNWKATEIDIKSMFIPILNKYIKWYENNEDKGLDYDMILMAVEKTKAEILKYFPDKPDIKAIDWLRMYKSEIAKESKGKDFTKALKTICDKYKRTYTDSLRVQAIKVLKE